MLLLNCIAVMNMYFLPNNDVGFSCTLGKLIFQKVWFLKQKKYFTLSMVLKERQRPYKKKYDRNQLLHFTQKRKLSITSKENKILI